MQDIVKTYASNSTAHGLPKIASAGSYKSRIFWLLVCIAAMVSFCYQSTILLQRYFSYPKTVKLEVSNQPVPFPAVSICNLRPLDIYDFVDVLYNENQTFRWNVGDFSYTGRPDSPKPVFEKYLILFANRYVAYNAYVSVAVRRGESKEWQFQSKRELFSRLTLSANFKIGAGEEGGVSKDQFIAKCEYAGVHCTHANFTQFVDPAYLNCYTFDMIRQQGISQTIYEGPDHGLVLLLYVPTMTIMGLNGMALNEVAFYQELSFGGEGARLVIHEQNTIPYPMTEGLDLPRGMSSTVGIKLQQSERLNPPHGNCTNQNTLVGTFVDYTYTMASCKKACLQNLVIDNCGCADISLPITSNINSTFCATFDYIPKQCQTNKDIDTNFDFCHNIFDHWFKRVKCMKNIRSNISMNLSAWETCNCYPRCQDVSYSSSISLSDWPIFEQSQKIVEDILFQEDFSARFSPQKAMKYFGNITYLKEYGTFQDYQTMIKEKNFLRINIYISDTSVVRIDEMAGYTTTQLVSDIGGQLGLWIGVSVITLVEVLELITKICRYIMDKKVQKENNNKSQQNSMYGHTEVRAFTKADFPNNTVHVLSTHENHTSNIDTGMQYRVGTASLTKW